VFQDYFHDTFIKAFKSIPGKKTLVIEESLKPVLNHLLKPIDPVAEVKSIMLLTDKEKLAIQDPTVIYVLRPDLDSLTKAIG